MTKEYFEAISHESLVEMAVNFAEMDKAYKEILKELAERTCESCLWRSYDSLMKDHYCGNRECSFYQVPVEKEDSCNKWKAE